MNAPKFTTAELRAILASPECEREFRGHGLDDSEIDRFFSWVDTMPSIVTQSEYSQLWERALSGDASAVRRLGMMTLGRIAKDAMEPAPQSNPLREAYDILVQLEELTEEKIEAAYLRDLALLEFVDAPLSALQKLRDRHFPIKDAAYKRKESLEIQYGKLVQPFYVDTAEHRKAIRAAIRAAFHA